MVRSQAESWVGYPLPGRLLTVSLHLQSAPAHTVYSCVGEDKGQDRRELRREMVLALDVPGQSGSQGGRWMSPVCDSLSLCSFTLLFLAAFCFKAWLSPVA